MGTRSLTICKDQKKNVLLNMYRQYDGYPTGHGAELAEFLNGGELVNGLSSRDSGAVFNGMGCLAAQIVARFKEDPGGIYLEPADARDVGEEYIYTVYPDKVPAKGKNGAIKLKVQAGCMTFFGLPGTKQDNMNIVFDDLPENYDGEQVEENEKNLPRPQNDFIESKQGG